MKQHNGMRPHDIVVLLKILLLEEGWFSKDLANELFISTSEISESLNRSKVAGLLDGTKRKVFVNNLLDFLQNGLTYVFPAMPGGITRGIPTAHSAPILKNNLVSSEIYVWPSKTGTEKGQSIQPLYPNAILAIEKDLKLYDVLALVDALRVGRVREKAIAIEKLKLILKNEYAY